MFRLMSEISVRQLNTCVFTCVFGLLSYAAFSIVFLGLEACPLCVSQQFFFLLVGLVSFISIYHNPNTKWLKIYAAIAISSAITGLFIASRQLWLQSLPAELVPACGPSLEYILDVFPFADILKSLFIGDGSCSEIDWSFLGLSMAGWAFIWFSSFILINVYILFKQYPEKGLSTT